MRFSSIVAPVTLAAAATAAPTLSARGYGGDECIPTDVLAGIQNAWISTLTNYQQSTAENLLYPGLQDFSDSINYIGGFPLGQVTFPSAQAYEAGQGAQPPIGFTVLNPGAIYTCDGYITLRWKGDVGSKQLPANGITILKAIKVGNDNVVGPTGYQLSEIYTEFNSAAWITDLGGSCPPPTFPSS
jgi:hypothetical protein